MKQFAVQVVFRDDTAARLLIECLRYAGIIGGLEDENPYSRFRIYPPRAIGDAQCESWANSNAQRINSFGPDIAAKVVTY